MRRTQAIHYCVSQNHYLHVWQGNAAIHYCVSHCNFDIVGLLLDTEVCDVKRPNKAGYTPAMLAALAYVQNEDHRDVIRRLFAASNINDCAEQVGDEPQPIPPTHPPHTHRYTYRDMLTHTHTHTHCLSLT